MNWIEQLKDRLARRWLRCELAQLEGNLRFYQERMRAYRKEREEAERLGQVYLARELKDKRDDVLRAFGQSDKDDPLLGAVRVLVESTFDEANQLAVSPEMSRQPGEAAHAAGGAYWITLLSERIRDAWVQSHQKITDH